jgi:hypothetical protein
MKLTDYPTPLTDEAIYPMNQIDVVFPDFARDLERKLAKCREALDIMLNTSAEMATLYADHSHLMALKNATETLTETQP